LRSGNDINIFQPNWFAQDEGHITRCNLSPTPSVPDGTGIEWYSEKELYTVKQLPLC
jgi:hypothetical protein